MIKTHGTPGSLSGVQVVFKGRGEHYEEKGSNS